MDLLRDLIASHEDWLIDRVVLYAKRHGYTEYTSTLKEAWRGSICGLTNPLLEALEHYDAPPEIESNIDFRSHPIARYGIEQARQHRARGITLVLFLGLTKYYRQSYCDLIDECGETLPSKKIAHLFIDRFYDLVELGFCSEWRSIPEDTKLIEVQNENRQIINEKNKYLTIFESLNDPVVLLDSDYQIQNMNLAAQVLLVGWSQPGAIYYSAEHNTRFGGYQLEDLLERAKAKEDFQIMLQTHDGLKCFDVRIQEMLDISEKFLGTVLIFNDVTEHKKARDAAEAANQAKSAFLATMSHEIRTPLNGLLGLARLLNDTSLSDQQIGYVNGINNASEVLRSVLNDILDYSKIEAGALDLELIDFELDTILQQVSDAVNASVINKGLNFDIEVHEDVPHILRSDPTKICQILLNLVGNAVKFTENGSINVRASFANEGAVNNLHFEVVDTGIGIEGKNRKDLFEAFTQQGAEKSRIYYGGTGLGLAICKKLVQSLGGVIDCQSRPTGGSIFRFTIPVLPPTGQREHERISALPEIEHKGLNVLLVEDNATNRMVAEGYLAKLAHHCTSVADGAKAIEALEKQSFDLVLLDDRMPVLDGAETLHAIRHHQEAAIASIPVIMNTASVAKNEIAQAFERGANGFLGKPFAPEDLALAISDCLSDNSQEGPIAGAAAFNVAADFFEDALLRQHLAALGANHAQSIVDAYLASSAELVERIVAERETKSLEVLTLAAHSLKSACRNVGLSYLADLAQDLELSAKNSDDQKTAFLIEKICDVNGVASDILRQKWNEMIAAE